MGHVMRLALIAPALHAQGHVLHLVLRDLSGADAALGDLAAVQPMPPFREWERSDVARLAQSEARALATCNAVMAATGGPPLSALHDLLAADEQFLLTWPELDHDGAGLQGRAGGHYWGALAARDQGLPAVWPEGGGEPLFAYLKADYPAIDVVLQQLAAAPCRTLAHVPGLGAAQRQRFTSAQLRFSDGAVSMVSAMAQAWAVLCHAGAGSVAAALQAGLPVLMLPTQAEQMLSARRVAGCGAGQWLLEADVGPRLLPALAPVLGDPALRQRAQALAARHSPAHYGNVAQRVPHSAHRNRQ